MDTIKEKLTGYIRSLTFKLPLLFVLNNIIIIIVVMGIVFFGFQTRMVDEYEQIGSGVLNLMEREINNDRINLYLNNTIPENEKLSLLNRLYGLKENYRDIIYMYAYKPQEDKWLVAFDLDSDDVKGDPPGSLYEPDRTFQKHMDEFLQGQQVGTLTGYSSDGFLVTCSKPIYDSNGRCVCYIFVDFSMKALLMKDLKFVCHVFEIAFVLFIIMIVVDVLVIRRSVTNPLSSMSGCMSKFKFGTEAQIKNNIKMLESLEIDTEDEIGDICESFMDVLNANTEYITELNKAKRTIKDNELKIKYMGEIMYEDSLTGVGNKAAYVEMKNEIDMQMKRGNSFHFAVMMIDVNNLKYVNDTFGHEKGDFYIKGCCSIISGICNHSPIYRIGGDEFVVMLKGRGYELRQTLLAKMMIAFNNSYKKKDEDPWKRFAASIGISIRHPNDRCFDDVFKRADTAMYEAKQKFKEKYGSYR